MAWYEDLQRQTYLNNFRSQHPVAVPTVEGEREVHSFRSDGAGMTMEPKHHEEELLTLELEALKLSLSVDPIYEKQITRFVELIAGYKQKGLNGETMKKLKDFFSCLTRETSQKPSTSQQDGRDSDQQSPSENYAGSLYGQWNEASNAYNVSFTLFINLLSTIIKKKVQSNSNSLLSYHSSFVCH